MTSTYQSKFDRANAIGSIVDTLGGPGVTQLFVHSITLRNLPELAAVTPGFEKFVERALVAARPDDVVCLGEMVDREYLQFLRTLGIGPRNGNIVVASRGVRSACAATLSDLLMTNDEVLANIGKVVKRNSRLVLNPYIASPKEFKLALRLETALGRKIQVLGGNSDIVEYANHKHNIRAKAIELGVPVPQGEIVELQVGEDGRPLDLTPLQIAIDRHIRETGKVIIKGSYGAGGSSTFIVKDDHRSIQDALSTIAKRVDNRIYVIEAMLDVTVSPNIQMYIEPGCGNILCVGITDQCFEENLMQSGNLYPSVSKTIRGMISSAQRMSKWLQAKGYAGIVGFDFGEYRGTQGLGYFLAEINPRINGATYSMVLMEHLNRRQKEKGRPYTEAFVSTVMKTKARSFGDLCKSYGHLFFDPESGKGSVPYNIGCLEKGKFDVVVFGKERDEAMGMCADFKALVARESS